MQAPLIEAILVKYMLAVKLPHNAALEIFKANTANFIVLLPAF
jgi:hypothetical protein